MVKGQGGRLDVSLTATWRSLLEAAILSQRKGWVVKAAHLDAAQVVAELRE